MTNSFVGMDCCVYCNEPKGILLHKHMKEIPYHNYSSPEPCDKCKKQFEAEGKVPMHEITVDYKGNINPTGRYIFLKREAVQGEQFIKMMNEKGFLFCDKETFESITKGVSTSSE